MRFAATRHLRAKVAGWASFLSNARLYAKHRLTGSSYSEYYADRMDRIIRKNPDWGLNLQKTFQIEYLKTHGLTPRNVFLDYGCGALAAGLHFVDFLDAGKYWGVDISEGVLREGRRRVEARGLIHKNPSLVHLPGGKLDVLPEMKFDRIWAQSVMTHMPPSSVAYLLDAIKEYMHEGTVFFMTYASSEDRIRHTKLKDWAYANADVRRLAQEAGLECEFPEDWNHPDDPMGTDRIARITMPKGTVTG